MLIFQQSQVAKRNDADDRLTKAEEHLANGRLVTVQQYGFDGASRITNKFTAPKMHPASFSTFSGTYDADNRLNGFAADTDGNLLAMPGVPEGNAASAPGALGATWDARNRLTTLTGAAGYRPAFSASYAYDSEGNRISKTVGGQTTSWTVNPHGPGGLSQVLVETAPGGAKKFFVHGPTGLLYDVDSAATPNVRHYHTDQVGSTVALTNAGGAVIGRAEYSAYGMVSYREGDTATPFLYNGAYGVMTDAESGLLNMRARYYHPWIGRFASPDPIGFSGGMNWFAYADGNPNSKMDPAGKNPIQAFFRWLDANDDSFYKPVNPPELSPTGEAIMRRLAYGTQGLVIGATGAIVLSAGAPVVVSGLVAVGVPATTASASVTFGIFAGGIKGLYKTGEETISAASSGDWDTVTFNLGSVAGSGLVSVNGGGRLLSEGIMGKPSAAPNTWNPIPILKYEWANRYQPNLGPPGTRYWATAPTPFSGGLAATGISAGIGTAFAPSKCGR